MIHIKDDYYIDSDAYQFILKQDMHRVDKEGKPVFDLIGYYATVEQALRGYMKTQMRGYSLDELLFLFGTSLLFHVQF